MTDRQTRLIASAILASGGAVTLAIGLLARATNYMLGGGAEIIGGFIGVAGGIMFLVDYVGTWKKVD